MDEILKMFGGTENIWNAIQKNATKVGIEATRTMLELYFVLKSPNTTMINKTLIVAALGYQLLPEDVLPRNKYGLLGFIDNGVTLAFAYNRVKSSVTPEIETQVNNILTSWFGISPTPENTYNSTNENNQDKGYTLQPQNINSQQYNYKPQNKVVDNHPPTSPQQCPIWNNDDDVVID